MKLDLYAGLFFFFAATVTAYFIPGSEFSFVQVLAGGFMGMAVINLYNHLAAIRIN